MGMGQRFNPHTIRTIPSLKIDNSKWYDENNIQDKNQNMVETEELKEEIKIKLR